MYLAGYREGAESEVAGAEGDVHPLILTVTGGLSVDVRGHCHRGARSSKVALTSRARVAWRDRRHWSPIPAYHPMKFVISGLHGIRVTDTAGHAYLGSIDAFREIFCTIDRYLEYLFGTYSQLAYY